MRLMEARALYTHRCRCVDFACPESLQEKSMRGDGGKTRKQDRQDDT